MDISLEIWDFLWKYGHFSGNIAISVAEIWEFFVGNFSGNVGICVEIWKFLWKYGNFCGNMEISLEIWEFLWRFDNFMDNVLEKDEVSVEFHM